MRIFGAFLILAILQNGSAHALVFLPHWRAVPRESTAWDAVGILIPSWNDASESGLLEAAPDGSCSASIVVRDRLSMNMADKALLLTNGHCAEPGTLLLPGERWESRASAIELYFLAGPGLNRRYAPLRVSRVVYASMTEADVAVLELDLTYGELHDLGIDPLELGEAQVGNTVSLVGVPVDGVPAREIRLQESRCELGASTVATQESSRFVGGAEHIDHYSWPNSFLHRCSMVGGHSGAPLIDFASRRVVAVNNSEVQPACFPHCTATGVSPRQRSNVAQGLGSVLQYLP